MQNDLLKALTDLLKELDYGVVQIDERVIEQARMTLEKYRE